MRDSFCCSLTLAFLLAACGDVRTGDDGFIVRDSAGIRIVENGPLDASLAVLAATEPEQVIGVVSGDEAYQLFRVSDVKRMADGGIAVANAGTRELRIYDAQGRHRATAGGPGRGPNEFRYPSAIRILSGDTLQVQDFLDRVYFTAAGEFIRRETNDRAVLAALAGPDGFSEGATWLGDGSLFAPIYGRTTGRPVPGPLYRPPMMLTRVSADFTTVDTLGDYGGILQQYLAFRDGGGVSSIVPPFAASTEWALGAADGTIVVGDNANPQIERFGPDGSHTIVRWTAPAQPITSAEVEEWKDRQRNAEWVQGQLPELERGWAQMDVPETKHFYETVAAGSDGTVWVQTGGWTADTTTLVAFAADGRYRGTARIAGRFRPYDSGPGWLLGILQDAEDVEFVQLYRLRAN